MKHESLVTMQIPDRGEMKLCFVIEDDCRLVGVWSPNGTILRIEAGRICLYDRLHNQGLIAFGKVVVRKGQCVTVEVRNDTLTDAEIQGMLMLEDL